MKRWYGEIEESALLIAATDVVLGLKRILNASSLSEARRAYWDEAEILHKFQRLLDLFNKEMYREE